DRGDAVHLGDQLGVRGRCLVVHGVEVRGAAPHGRGVDVEVAVRHARHRAGSAGTDRPRRNASMSFGLLGSLVGMIFCRSMFPDCRSSNVMPPGPVNGPIASRTFSTAAERARFMVSVTSADSSAGDMSRYPPLLNFSLVMSPRGPAVTPGSRLFPWSPTGTRLCRP